MAKRTETPEVEALRDEFCEAVRQSSRAIVQGDEAGIERWLGEQDRIEAEAAALGYKMGARA